MVSCPLIDRACGHPEGHVIPWMQGGCGGEPFHRIPTLPRAQEAGWHAVKRPIKHPVSGMLCGVTPSRPLLTPTRDTSLRGILQEFLDHRSVAHHSEVLGGAWW